MATSRPLPGADWQPVGEGKSQVKEIPAPVRAGSVVWKESDHG